MKISAIAPWFGSKRILAPRIVDALGPHRTYWEPFCGSMSVLFAKPACAQETVGDLHGDLIHLAKVIQLPSLGAALYRRLRRTLCCEGLFHEACERWKAAGPVNLAIPDVDRAYDFFIASWLGRNGVAGTQSYNQGFCVRWTGKGGQQATRLTSAIDSIPAWRHRLRRVTILQRDGFEMLEKIEDEDGAAIYCDPPYLAETRNLNNGKGRTKDSSKYVHDFESTDHDRLAKLLARFTRARVVVSYYDHPRLRQLYAEPWTLIHCEVAKAMAQQGRRGSTKVVAPEVLLVNHAVTVESCGLFDDEEPVA